VEKGRGLLSCSMTASKFIYPYSYEKDSKFSLGDPGQGNEKMGPGQKILTRVLSIFCGWGRVGSGQPL